jgi:lipoprotein-anchoring transpeptidase ErfK/SrfK
MPMVGTRRGVVGETNRPNRPVGRRLRWTCAGLALAAGTLWWLFWAPREELVAVDGAPTVEALRAEIQRARPQGPIVVIDTAANLLYLRRGETVLLEATCSTGSGIQLVSGDRRWTFRTPHGAFRIVSVTRDPVWRKPDWAFLEEGEPIPANDALRYERGVLGEYALGIGDGYFIHGTLYTRLLGTNVTHGCVRLGDEDLRFLARHAPVGTPVFVF